MKSINFLETSKVIVLVRKCDLVYKDSWISRNLEKFLNQVKVCFRYSFLGRITETGGEDNREIFYNSKAARWIVNSCNVRKNRIVNYVNSSIIINSMAEVEKELHFLPVKAGGMVIFTAILTNMFLSLFLHKEIKLFGWVIRAVLLFAAFWGMFCKVGWEELKKTSWFVRRIETDIQKG
mgnify:CR=1 FL=1